MTHTLISIIALAVLAIISVPASKKWLSRRAERAQEEARRDAALKNAIARIAAQANSDAANH